MQRNKQQAHFFWGFSFSLFIATAARRIMECVNAQTLFFFFSFSFSSKSESSKSFYFRPSLIAQWNYPTGAIVYYYFLLFLSFYVKLHLPSRREKKISNHLSLSLARLLCCIRFALGYQRYRKNSRLSCSCSDTTCRSGYRSSDGPDGKRRRRRRRRSYISSFLFFLFFRLLLHLFFRGWWSSVDCV